jgi:hypothetical protein
MASSGPQRTDSPRRFWPPHAYHRRVPSVVQRLARAGRLSAYTELVRTLPRRQLISFWLAIFSTFAMFGFVLDILALGRQPWSLLALNVVASGSLAVGYGMAGAERTGRPWRYAVLLAIHLSYVFLVPRWFSILPETPPGRLVVDALGTMLTVMVGYICFLYFINVTAARYLRAQAEIALARDIHRVLVPEIRRTSGDYEFFGWSVPSGDVGGDLVDLLETDEGWLGYVADVLMGCSRAPSGHGRATAEPSVRCSATCTRCSCRSSSPRCTSRPPACAAAPMGRSIARWPATCRSFECVTGSSRK